MGQKYLTKADKTARRLNRPNYGRYADKAFPGLVGCRSVNSLVKLVIGMQGRSDSEIRAAGGDVKADYLWAQNRFRTLGGNGVSLDLWQAKLLFPHVRSMYMSYVAKRAANSVLDSRMSELDAQERTMKGGNRPRQTGAGRG